MAARPTLLSVSGIYRIDGPNGKFYIGSAKWVARRWIEHKRDLKRSVHGNPKLQAAWNKYGEGAFTISVLEVVPELEKLIDREQHWIDTLNPVAHGYNIKLKADSPLGLKHSEETRRLMSEAHKGRKHGPMSDEQKKLLSAALKGRPQPKEAARKSAESRRGKKRPPEVGQKVSAARKGMKFSDEHRANLSAAKRGKKASEGTKAKMRAAHALRRQQQTISQQPAAI